MPGGASERARERERAESFSATTEELLRRKGACVAHTLRR